MALGRTEFRTSLAVVCLMLLGSIQNVVGSGHTEIHFIRYTDTCREDLGTNKCDPMFSFCLSTPQSGSPSVNNCNYASTGETSDHYQNTNHVELEHLASFLGQKNPWVVQVNKFIEPRVMFVIKVRDADIFEHDHLQTWGTILTETIWKTKELSQWVEKVTTSGDYAMRFRVRMYCDPFYHTTKCDIYCKPEDSSAGHYTCDSDTGAKKCLPGWKGSQCSDDIDECSLGFCTNGQCTNLPGDYRCDCSPNYTDKNCSVMMNPCRIEPCKNGATCFAHASEHKYICQCTKEWDGTHCEVQKHPCLLNPCQNSGICTNSSDTTNYTCSCVYPYTGVNCEITMTTTTLETTTSTPTTVPTVTKPPPKISQISEESTTILPEIGDGNMQALRHENADSSFQMWYVAIIVAVIVIAVIVLAIFLVRRKKQEQKNLQKLPVGLNVSYSGDELAFVNGLYTNASRSNSEVERQTRQLPSVPANPATENSMATARPTYSEVSETEGATGGSNEHDGDLKKSSISLVKATDPALGTLSCPVNERALKNPYADFKSLSNPQAGSNTDSTDNNNLHDEIHYHDLDEIAILTQQDEQNNSTDGGFNYTIQDVPVVAMVGSPYDTPPNNSFIYAIPRLPPLEQTNSSNGAKDDLSNEPALRADASNDDNDDSSDGGYVQEDIAQLRNAVEANMNPFGVSAI